MTVDLDKYVVVKLISGEEIIGQMVKEDDHDVKIQFPMVVKHVSRILGGYPVESIVLGTYSHFCADDEFTFNKQHIMVLKDLDPRYVEEYHRSVDDFLGQAQSPPPYDPNELKELSDKLKNMFRDNINMDEDDLPETLSININGNKTLH